MNVPAELQIMPGISQVGGGSMPTAQLPTIILSCLPENMSVDKLAINLRMGEPAVVARVQEGKFQLDLRTVQQGELDMLAEVMAKVINTGEVT
ncbi:hypothetical protein N752_26710 [Desulforamulus aquiferis]|nr:hypothetical protein N752_26710 [Desulforamulus aquiferis]